MTPIDVFASKGALCLNVGLATTAAPSSYYECLQTPEKAEWEEALAKHMAGKMANGTCTWQPLPDGVSAIRTKLVPGIKYNESDNTIRERTMRWVACGYTQVEGVNYNETYTATSKAIAIRVFLNMIMALGMHGRKFDVPKAFTKADIDSDIWVLQPEERRLPGLLCKKKDARGRPYAGKLHKALEGLKQAGHLFQTLNTETLSETLVKKLGFRQMESHPTTFVLHTSDGVIMHEVWVDDFATGYTTWKALMRFVESYRAVEGLDLKDEGELTQFAGVQINWIRDGVEIFQRNGIERGVLRHFPEAIGLHGSAGLPATMDSKTRQTSLDACGLVKEGGDRAFVQKYPPYLSFVALAMYYAAWTVPEATFVAVFLARFVLDPNEACFKAGISLMSYLYHTRTERIRYTKSGWDIPSAIKDAGLDASVKENYGIYFSPDSSWKIKQGSALNMTYGGWVVFMFGAAVDWSTKLIKVICHSSAEAEVAAGCFCGKRCMFVRSYLNELKSLGIGAGINGPFVFLIDNSACGPLTSNVGVSRTTEHFLRWQHYLRWLVVHGMVKVIWTPTDMQSSDILTKVLAAGLFIKHRNKLRGKY